MGGPSKGGSAGQRIRRNLQECRSRMGLTVATLCERCGLTTERLECYEQGERIPSIDELSRIAAVLGVPVSDLVG